MHPNVHNAIQSCSTLFNLMNCSIPDFPVLHHSQEFAQTQVHWVSDAIQPSHSSIIYNRQDMEAT